MNLPFEGRFRRRPMGRETMSMSALIWGELPLSPEDENLDGGAIVDPWGRQGF